MLNQNFLNRKEVTSKTKITRYKTTYIPLEGYWCESWLLCLQHNCKLQATEMRHLRKIEGNTKREKLEETGSEIKQYEWD